MKTYQHFASVLTQLLGADTAVRIRVDGYMPLSIEAVGTSADGNRLISICHVWTAPTCQEETRPKDESRCCSHVSGLLMSPDHLQLYCSTATGPDEIRLSNTNHYVAILVAWQRTVLSDIREHSVCSSSSSPLTLLLSAVRFEPLDDTPSLCSSRHAAAIPLPSGIDPPNGR